MDGLKIETVQEMSHFSMPLTMHQPYVNYPVFQPKFSASEATTNATTNPSQTTTVAQQFPKPESPYSVPFVTFYGSSGSVSGNSPSPAHPPPSSTPSNYSSSVEIKSEVTSPTTTIQPTFVSGPAKKKLVDNNQIQSLENTTLPPRKQVRNQYSKYQKGALEQSYMTGAYVSTRRREEMAKELNLTPKQVKVWYQNRRQKDKRRDQQLKKHFNYHQQQQHHHLPSLPQLQHHPQQSLHQSQQLNPKSVMKVPPSADSPDSGVQDLMMSETIFHHRQLLKRQQQEGGGIGGRQVIYADPPVTNKVDPGVLLQKSSLSAGVSSSASSSPLTPPSSVASSPTSSANNTSATSTSSSTSSVDKYQFQFGYGGAGGDSSVDKLTYDTPPLYSYLTNSAATTSAGSAATHNPYAPFDYQQAFANYYSNYDYLQQFQYYQMMSGYQSQSHYSADHPQDAAQTTYSGY